MPCTKAPCLKHRATTFGLHTATKTVDASATTDFRLIGSLWHLLSPTATEPRKGPAPLGSDCWLSEREDYTVLAHHGQISQVVIRRRRALPSGHMPTHACRPQRPPGETDSNLAPGKHQRYSRGATMQPPCSAVKPRKAGSRSGETARAGTLAGVRRWLDPNEIGRELGRAGRLLATETSAPNVWHEIEQARDWPSRMAHALGPETAHTAWGELLIRYPKRPGASKATHAHHPRPRPAQPSFRRPFGPVRSVRGEKGLSRREPARQYC